MPRPVVLSCAFVAASLTPALAHTAGGIGNGLASGFTHPLLGSDHLLAMVSVGIWGAQLGAPAIWMLPIGFPMIMAGGGALGVLGAPLPAPELLIAFSVLTLGALVARAQQLPLAAAFAIVAVFAVAHGHAHGAELPASANALAFSVGFVIATGMLHAIGIALGLLVKWPAGALMIRGLGGLIALVGIYFIVRYAKA
jgi:urease accessory protein